MKQYRDSFLAISQEHFLTEELPDYDEILSIRKTKGTYSLDRMGSNVDQQIAFLQAVKAKYGANSAVRIVEPYDGYPGYIQVGYL